KNSSKNPKRCLSKVKRTPPRSSNSHFGRARLSSARRGGRAMQQNRAISHGRGALNNISEDVFFAQIFPGNTGQIARVGHGARSCLAKRMECVELAPAFEPRDTSDSGSKLHALHTLR